MFHRTTQGHSMYFCKWLSTQWQKIFFEIQKSECPNYYCELRYIFFSYNKMNFGKYGKATRINLIKKFSTYGNFQDLQEKDITFVK